MKPDENERLADEIVQIVDEIAQEMADLAVEQVSKQEARSPDETFIKRRFAGTMPDDPEMKAAMDEAEEVADRLAYRAAQKFAAEAARRARDEAYKRILEWAYGRPSTTSTKVQAAEVQKLAEEEAEGAYDEAEERTRQRVRDEVRSMLFPEEFRKAMARRRPRR